MLKKVVFKLHESFDQPSRTCDQPPSESLDFRHSAFFFFSQARRWHCVQLLTLFFVYRRYEVTEKGWGEFEIQIKLYFVDAREKPISFFHLLKLYPNVEAGEHCGRPECILLAKNDT